HEDTQVYGTLLLKDLTNQTMLESKAYKTYYAFASGEKTPKLKYVQKKADSNTSPKQKPVQATKGTRLKTKAKVAKSDKKKQPAKIPKAKGLDVLSKVALTKAEQLKLATKRSKTQFHSSHVSGSGDGVDTQSKVPDEQHLKTTGVNKGTGTIPRVPNVPIYESESEKESWSDSGEEDEDDENDSDHKSNGNDDDANDDHNQEGDDTNDDDEEIDSDITESNRIKIPVLNQYNTEYYEEEEDKIEDEESMDEEEDNEVIKELYEDVNVNLGNEDTDMTNADQGASEQQNVSQESGFEQVEEDAHVTLTPVLDTQKADEPEVTKDDWFKKLKRPLTPDFDWNKRQHVDSRPPQTWISQVSHAKEPQILVGPAFELLKGTCKSLTELKYHLEECSKATTERLDWHNPEGKPYPFDLSKPLPLIRDHRGHQGPKRQHFYGFAANMASSKDVYSRKRIITVTKLSIMKKYDYGHLEEIEVHREDQKLYKFREGDFPRLRLQDIEDMLLLLVQKKLTNLIINERAWVMIQDIDKQLYERRLMRNLKKFVGGREYENDLRLLERTI
ncbi:hypothetical protein Tco_1267930, partial [Tanacetum coccineum]